MPKYIKVIICIFLATLLFLSVLAAIISNPLSAIRETATVIAITILGIAASFPIIMLLIGNFILYESKQNDTSINKCSDSEQKPEERTPREARFRAKH